MDKSLEALLKGQAKLPSIPAVAQQVLAMANNPNTSSEQLASTLSADPAIASTILRYVNSAAYAQVEKIVSVQRAIVSLGFREVTNLALTFSLLDMRRRGTDDGLNAPYLWRRSLMSAIAAKAIGRQARERELEPLFLAGLLQDIGMLGLSFAKPEIYKEISDKQTDHSLVAAHEASQLKIDHAKFGGFMLQKWGLPDKIVNAIAQSHTPAFSREGENQEIDPFNTCVAISGIVADVFLDSENRAKHAARMADFLKRGLGIDSDGSRNILKTVQEDLKSLAWVLEKLVADADEIQALRVQAQEALSDETVAELNNTAGSDGDCAITLDDVRNSDFLKSAADFQDVLSADEFEKAIKTHQTPEKSGTLHLALMRIDNIRQIQEDYGEKVPQLLLKVVGRNILKTLRGNDLVTRYGDVFGIVLVGSTEDGAHIAMDRLLECFRGVNYSVGDGKNVELIMSVGIAVGTPDHNSSLDEALEIAMKALNAAHQAGQFEIVAHLRAA
ncbi:diguanylate cyclase (GGDEF)-like protein [Litorivivens lipolytica]|uniref:Diguanylate cyclase (GGDEF)-like protein n=1 Tax=Litorivivens lipolytica TaxID=1524264 RepID=A0A7W4Z848_9GAMM|nr:HDOD domain-containing protein [Litorivivens lipolytica]MBB3048665.1 diguanylate cyclase (GGDEF)-like protein [Litorivivens lipolytica]